MLFMRCFHQHLHSCSMLWWRHACVAFQFSIAVPRRTRQKTGRFVWFVLESWMTQVVDKVVGIKLASRCYHTERMLSIIRVLLLLILSRLHLERTLESASTAQQYTVCTTCIITCQSESETVLYTTTTTATTTITTLLFLLVNLQQVCIRIQ